MLITVYLRRFWQTGSWECPAESGLQIFANDLDFYGFSPETLKDPAEFGDDVINDTQYDQIVIQFNMEGSNDAVIGYLVNIFSGESDKLFLKRKKTFMEAKIARTSLENSFPPRYVESEELYISSNGDTPVKLKQSKKSIINYFKSNSDKIKKFIKSEKLKVSELSSVVRIFEFAENL